MFDVLVVGVDLCFYFVHHIYHVSRFYFMTSTFMLLYTRSNFKTAEKRQSVQMNAKRLTLSHTTMNKKKNNDENWFKFLHLYTENAERCVFFYYYAKQNVRTLHSREVSERRREILDIKEKKRRFIISSNRSCLKAFLRSFERNETNR